MCKLRRRGTVIEAQRRQVMALQNIGHRAGVRARVAAAGVINQQHQRHGIDRTDQFSANRRALDQNLPALWRASHGKGRQAHGCGTNIRNVEPRIA